MKSQNAVGKAMPRLGLVSALISIGLTAGGCAPRPSSNVLIPVTSSVEGSKSVSILTATTRMRSEEQRAAFSNGRAHTVNYEQYTISLPPRHVSGQIEWPSETPGNPQKDFVVSGERPLDQAGFPSAIARQLRSKNNGGGDVLVFVHGYNTNYQEAVFRMAQLTADGDFDGASVLFAWPSRGTLEGYLADRESSTYSRDYLEQVLNEIARVPNVRSINLVAHSMGNWLAVETLRQAKLRGQSPFIAKLGNVVLLSPDIDIDVFGTELDVIGKLKHPIIIALARNDLALAASQHIAGDVARAGNVLIDNPRAQAAIERYDLKVVDLSQVNDGDFLGHNKFMQALPQLVHIVQNENAAGDVSASAPGIFVVDAAGDVLATPLRIGNALLGR
jgi:esterase/lipase superfamily enzyme